MNAVNLRSPQDFSAFLRQCINGSIYFTRHYNGATTQSNCISLWKMLNDYVRIRRICIRFIAHVCLPRVGLLCLARMSLCGSSRTNPLVIEEDSPVQSTVPPFLLAQGIRKSPVKPVSHRRESFRLSICIGV